MNARLSKYGLDKNGDFVIENYNFAKPWASFFPGIAGLYGIPLWAFYVNRGQCIVSAGIHSKDEAIMEFLPANKAYQLVSSQCFRTFLKIKNKGKCLFYEPFSPCGAFSGANITNRMIIRPHELMIVEENLTARLRTQVSYFTLPNEPFTALVREVTVESMSNKPLDIEMLDGLSVVVPSGVNNFFLKEMSRTIEAWMTVERLKNGVAVYKLTTDPKDVAHVVFIKGANFYASFEGSRSCSSSKIIVDPAKVFGDITDFSYPQAFLKSSSFAYSEKQVARNKTPCGFSFVKAKLVKGAKRKLVSVLGHVFDVDDINRHGIGRLNEDFINKKRQENKKLIDGVMDRIFTVSGSDNFDLYARQTFLDNVLRGGLPTAFTIGKNKKKSVYVFSRKHGDLERDYNRFCVLPTYFSHGEGNYRDVNQNRRCDVFFEPSLEEKNICDFMNLIQLDGYNPLVFKGEKLVVSEDDFKKSGLSSYFHEKDSHKIGHILSLSFTVGSILQYLMENKVVMSCSLESFVATLLSLAKSDVDAAHTEGYWSDHWTYNTDLLESFKSLYPDHMKWLLFEKNDFSFFDTHVFVRPRQERYVLRNGELRQYHSLCSDEDKLLSIQKRHHDQHKVRCDNGAGEILTTTLIGKFICLIVNKLATLDPSGVGIEMEAEKPNWYDSLNGLPGLLGSSISETFELKRLIELLKKIILELNITPQQEFSIVLEIYDFFEEMKSLLSQNIDAFSFWNHSNTVKEAYRYRVRRGVQGEFIQITVSELLSFFELALKKLNAGIAKSFERSSGYYYTYFTHQMVKHDSSLSPAGQHIVIPKEFKQKRLPLFLEGFVHALRSEASDAKNIFMAVKKSPLWDKKLKMYKVNTSLERESYEIGRTKAFTPGWLENESIWLHMEYKYLLEILKNGLYDEFYEDFFSLLVPFQKPAVYGRSILENSSFIASSAHPDTSLHGRGFVARLSGSTAELIHMWLLMNIGAEPFYLGQDGDLCLRLRPALPIKLFTKKSVRRDFVDSCGCTREVALEKDSYGFLFLNKTLIVYRNPKRKNTFGQGGVAPVRIAIYDQDREVATVEGCQIASPYAAMVREGKIDRIEVELG
ncbi:MAG: hypothetical protein ABIC68_01930 [Candidatus Omnitrophota bacterium]